jgi:hypothetical protein
MTLAPEVVRSLLFQAAIEIRPGWRCLVSLQCWPGLVALMRQGIDERPLSEVLPPKGPVQGDCRDVPLHKSYRYHVLVP